MSKLEKKYSLLQFSLFRILFGAYLAFYFIRLIPYAREIFSSNGMVNDITDNWTNILIPHVFSYLAQPAFIIPFLITLTCLAACLSLGLYRRTVSLLLWAGWAILFNLNNLTGDPSLPFIGLMLLALAVIPSGEPLALSNVFINKQKQRWYMPSVLYWGLWFIFGASFTVSGLEKHMSTIWTDGTAILYFYQGPITFHYFVTDILKTLPLWTIQVTTWIVLYSQILALPAILFKQTRLLFWVVTTATFAFGLLILDLTDVLLGMLLFYLFIFDSTWLEDKHVKFISKIIPESIRSKIHRYQTMHNYKVSSDTEHPEKLARIST